MTGEDRKKSGHRAYFRSNQCDPPCQQFYYYTAPSYKRNYHFDCFLNAISLVQQSKYIIANKIYILKLVYKLSINEEWFPFWNTIKRISYFEFHQDRQIICKKLSLANSVYETRMNIWKCQRPVVSIIQRLTGEGWAIAFFLSAVYLLNEHVWYIIK